MMQENQNVDPEAAPGGYGTPTAEQEMGGSQQPKAVDTNTPQAGNGGQPVPRDPDAPLGGDADSGTGSSGGGADLPSSAADIDESNDDSKGSAPVSSEPGQEAAGLPDGSGSDLPQEETPKDDDGESFDAG